MVQGRAHPLAHEAKVDSFARHPWTRPTGLSLYFRRSHESLPHLPSQVSGHSWRRRYIYSSNSSSRCELVGILCIAVDRPHLVLGKPDSF